jgi:hypothetical protein
MIVDKNFNQKFIHLYTNVYERSNNYNPKQITMKYNLIVINMQFF